MDAICNEKDFRLGQLSTSKYENIEMTMVAKMKLIYPPTITNMERTIMCISSPRIKWVGNHIKEETRAILEVDKWITRMYFRE